MPPVPTSKTCFGRNDFVNAAIPERFPESRPLFTSSAEIDVPFFTT
jgi:hypothetical protein